MGLILLRHTKPKVDPGICYGQTDLDIQATFEAEAEMAMACLPHYIRIVSSPLIRCRKLAAFIGCRTKLPVKEDVRLMEMDFGHWEGRAWADIPRAELDAWANDFFHARPHGGESVATLQSRVMEAIKDWGGNDAPTLLVTHAGCVRAALAAGKRPEDFNTEIDFGGHVTISASIGVPDE